MNSKKIFVLLFAIILLFSAVIPVGCLRKEKPLNVIVVFHNHQPFYKDPVSSSYILPWVRLHASKDYYRMPYLVSLFPEVKISFDLSGSLIEQLEDYSKGYKDRRQILSEKSPSELTDDEKIEILSIPGGFFDLNWDHILKKIPLYKSILDKRQQVFKEYSSPLNKKAIVSSFSDSEFLNLQTLFNLFWLDIDYIKNDLPLSKLYEKAMNGVNFTIEDKTLVLDAQMKILNMVFEEYKKLAELSQIELFSTPFAHPISPLLVDFGWSSDLEKQVEKTNEIFEKHFGFKPKGVWASECAINDESLKVFNKYGWNFTISDTENLSLLGIDTKSDPLAKYIPYNINGETIFFRDKYISDGISFRYSGKSVEESLKDIEDTLLSLSKENKSGQLVYTIALDGENAWEYYENDGNDFLKGFYQKLSDLQKEDKIITITPSEYINKFGKGKEVAAHTISVLDLQESDISTIKSYSNLPRKGVSGYFGESSWVNPTLDTWIGEIQENVAWMWLKEARDNLIKASSLSEGNMKDAFELLMRAEGSDWFWWYGSDQDSGNDPSFDRLFKIYLAQIYKLMGKNPPNYLYGNFFPDGFPYKYVDVQIDENSTITLPSIASGIKISASYKNNIIQFITQGDYKNITLAVYNGKTLNPFFSLQDKPTNFTMFPYPYEKESIGIPIDYELSFTNYSKNYYSLNLNAEEFDKSNLFIAFASIENGNLLALSAPIHLKLPFKLEGELICELLDDEGDDNGPGSYTYPLNEVFKNAGKNLFDLISLRILDSSEYYIFEIKTGNIGGNPWNGPNGISFQIIEVYLDTKEGGILEAIESKGSRVQIDSSHPWDTAFRIAGWSYGNYIKTSDEKVYQGELIISVDNNKNLIYASVPKKYLEIKSDYKPYIAVISGSQDGYSTGYFRVVSPVAMEWSGGGALQEAYDKNLTPNVYDIFVPEGKTQKEILLSFDLEKEAFSMIPMLPLAIPVPSPKVTAKVDLNIKDNLVPGKTFEISYILSNIGKADQKNNEGNEFEAEIPEYLILLDPSSTSGTLSISGKNIYWNGAINKDSYVKINLKLKLEDNVPNAKKLIFSGKAIYDSKNEGKNSIETNFEESIFVKYPVKIIIPFDSLTFTSNGNDLSFGLVKSKFDSNNGELFVTVKPIVEALGATYEKDTKSNKITIVFLQNKYEHWIGQNKSLLNGSAIPLVDGKPEIVSYFESDQTVLPLSAIASAFKFKYKLDTSSKTAYLDYIP